ncbi:Actin-like protein arp9 [Elasticomyces elasticus]|nr:Actin-like protein arp9 [Elasticomyces elasticus]
MPPFKDEQILIIAPGSQTTLAQLGLPESFTPARVRLRSCMFPAEKAGEYEPFKVRRKERKPVSTGDQPADGAPASGVIDEDDVAYEEDYVSEDGAIWPMKEGRVVDWECFFALLNHVYNSINPPFHTPILLVGQPIWTAKEQEKVTQFVFEKFKTPAFGLMDAAMATTYAYGVPTATVVDVGLDKTDITAVVDFLIQHIGRGRAVPQCGGEVMTQRLLQLLGQKGFSREMCEQLKRSPICEVLRSEAELPNGSEVEEDSGHDPASAASTGANGSGPGQRKSSVSLGQQPRGPGPDTETGDGMKEVEDNEGVLDIASIVTSGNMNEYLAKKEREKAEKAAAKKKGSDAAAALLKSVKLPNAKRERNSFVYHDFALHDALKDMRVDSKGMADVQAAMDQGPGMRQPVTEHLDDEPTSPVTQNGENPASGGLPHRELEVGTERFQAANGGILETLADAIHRTISAVPEVSKRGELWDSMIIVGNGAKIRGFKEALLATLHSKYIISPSSATIFMSELPSNFSTPLGTGANTPQPQAQPHGGSHVNPLLLAATTAQNPHLNPASAALPAHMPQSSHSSHAQAPTSIKLAKIPEYFPEWKEVGYDEAAFLGAQVAGKVLFVVDQGISKGYMTRMDYNDQGPSCIHEYLM